MKYGTDKDRTVNTYIALAIIFVVSGSAALAILRAIEKIDFSSPFFTGHIGSAL